MGNHKMGHRQTQVNSVNYLIYEMLIKIYNEFGIFKKSMIIIYLINK